ncbi:hypothetical protein PDE_08584 [Penicillium oxalicum 114-2]|uniref:Uncharacterized protein n=1 Tax=Penicillium oxalicum (strain 114-2 / CGMCC 5302) TaxID=933388 RepID=S8BEW4_PENO1|nr:hypothetical protein PDE_08584 [Penicillium oxalicum 114-2]
MSLVYPARRVRSEINSIDRVNSSSSNLGRTGDFSSPDLGNHKKSRATLHLGFALLGLGALEPVLSNLSSPRETLDCVDRMQWVQKLQKGCRSGSSIPVSNCAVRRVGVRAQADGGDSSVPSERLHSSGPESGLSASTTGTKYGTTGIRDHIVHGQPYG